MWKGWVLHQAVIVCGSREQDKEGEAAPFVACCALVPHKPQTGCAIGSWSSAQSMFPVRRSKHTGCYTIPDSWGQQLVKLQAHTVMFIQSEALAAGSCCHETACADVPAAIVLVFVTLLVLSVNFTSSVKSGVVIKLQAGRVRLLTRLTF